LAAAGRPIESLPYLYQAAHAPSAPWQTWQSYGNELFNGSLASPGPQGDTRTARSSIERVAMMREAIEALERAALLAPTPQDRAIMSMSAGQQFKIWGFPWEALERFHMAGTLDPQWTQDSQFYAALMRRPASQIVFE
jgi:hypothetical protein